MATSFEKAMSLIDDAHALDPTRTTATNSSEEVPYELYYARGMTDMLHKRWNFTCSSSLPSSPSESLQLATRAQHLRRWEVPRTTYPQTRAGYLQWRMKLATRQAELAGDICREVGFPEAAKVERLIGKRKRQNGGPNEEEKLEASVLEDIACLMFLKDGLKSFVSDKGKEKCVGVVQATWKKMTVAGRQMAMDLRNVQRQALVWGEDEIWILDQVAEANL